jgi:hypothetical protein
MEGAGNPSEYRACGERVNTVAPPPRLSTAHPAGLAPAPGAAARLSCNRKRVRTFRRIRPRSRG